MKNKFKALIKTIFISRDPNKVLTGFISQKLYSKAFKLKNRPNPKYHLMGYHKDHNLYFAWDNRKGQMRTEFFVYPDDCIRWLYTRT